MTNRDILCFAGNDWWAHNPSPEKHWMRTFAEDGNRIIYVNSIGVGLPRLNAEALGKRLRRKLASMARWIRHPHPGLWIITPWVFPLWSNSVVRWLNICAMLAQLGLLMRLLRFRGYVLWAGIPTPALLLPYLRPKRIIYYYQDLYTAYFEDQHFSPIMRYDAELLNAADALICASIGLLEKKRAAGKPVFYIPHGIPESFLDSGSPAANEVPAALVSIPHPLIGYWGSIDVAFDRELIARCAREHPDWSFVLVGGVISDLHCLQDLPNVHLTGFIPLEEIPRYGRQFDVCLLSFMQSEWILHCCPVKYREYLALGKPVVSVPILEVEKAFPGMARIATTAEEFCRGIEEELRTDSVEKQSMRKALVRERTWSRTAAEVARVISGEEA